MTPASATTERPDILVIAPYRDPTLAALEEAFTCHHLWKADDGDAFIDGIGGRVRGIATRAVKGASAAMMDRLPGLEIISVYGTGIDLVDLPAARSRGVVVTNTPDAPTIETANLGMALLLAVGRRIVRGDRWVRSGSWEKGKMPRAQSISGRRLGIVGLGRIGQAIARRAAAFDMEVVYHGPRAKDVPYRYYPDIVAMAGDCDYLMLCCVGTPETRHLVDARVLDALGPDGTLINISRGAVVDEAVLVRALVDGRIGAAGLDVFENEPHVPKALLDLENVVLLPHIGSSTEQTVAAMEALMLDNLITHFSGQPVVTPVP
jgi:lactate dehydrogenase-like 2-hydroxyacid dehydrogenase